jgi:hypothetical protein
MAPVARPPSDASALVCESLQLRRPRITVSSRLFRTDVNEDSPGPRDTIRLATPRLPGHLLGFVAVHDLLERARKRFEKPTDVFLRVSRKCFHRAVFDRVKVTSKNEPER